MITSPDSIWETSSARQLAQVVTAIDSIDVMQAFLRDVMTEKEIIEISSRLEAARMLSGGAKYADIIKKTKLSSRTIARISEWVQNGYSGYQAALEVIDHTTPIQKP
jgi:TrpR-related protein YerC/YecD